MAHNSHTTTGGVIKNYTFTALLSFCIMFVLFISLAQCHGPYKKHSSHHAATEHQATEEHHTEQQHH